MDTRLLKENERPIEDYILDKDEREFYNTEFADSPGGPRRFFRESYISGLSLLIMHFEDEERKLTQSLKNINRSLIDQMKRVKSINSDEEEVFPDIKCDFLLHHALNSLDENYKASRMELRKKIILKHREALKAIENDEEDVVKQIREFEELVYLYCIKGE